MQRRGRANGWSSSVSLFLDRGRRERAQHQYGDDEREDDDFLEVGGIERGERLDGADNQRRYGGQRIADEATDDRGDETFQPDQESGVVIKRGDRDDQD